MCDLECSHCGGIAFTSRDYDATTGRYLFTDGDGEACDACGHPGHVVVDEEPDDDNDEAEADAYWSNRDGVDDMCKDPLCSSCNEARRALGLITPARVNAIAAVGEIVDDLTDRRGLKQQWWEIDNEIRWGIVEAWIGIVEKDRTSHPISTV